jgi:hypothetical protein
MLITIKVTTSSPELSSLLLRQAPKRLGIWNNCRFIVNEPVERCDWWIICHSSAIKNPETTICDPDHVVYLSMEPSEGSLSQAFYDQFSKLILCDRRIKHSNIRYENVSTWWIGINVRFENEHKFSPQIGQDYDTLSSMLVPKKLNRISIICSNKNFLPGHRKRLQFLEKLKKEPISRNIDFFGFGNTPVSDKIEAILSYKYHLVLENSIVNDYWSEKFGDSLLGFSLPIYYGCPNIKSYFPENSFIKIDINDFENVVDILEKLILEDPFKKYLPKIIEARNLVLNDYNIFQIMSDICLRPASKYAICRVKPAYHFKASWPRRFLREIVHYLQGG